MTTNKQMADCLRQAKRHLWDVLNAVLDKDSVLNKVWKAENETN